MSWQRQPFRRSIQLYIFTIFIFIAKLLFSLLQNILQQNLTPLNFIKFKMLPFSSPSPGMICLSFFSTGSLDPVFPSHRTLLIYLMFSPYAIQALQHSPTASPPYFFPQGLLTLQKQKVAMNINHIPYETPWHIFIIYIRNTFESPSFEIYSAM